MVHIKTITGALTLIVCIIFGSDAAPWLILGACGAVLAMRGAVEWVNEDKKRPPTPEQSAMGGVEDCQMKSYISYSLTCDKSNF